MSNRIGQAERDRILAYALEIVRLDGDGVVVDWHERIDQVARHFGISRDRALRAVASAAGLKRRKQKEERGG